MVLILKSCILDHVLIADDHALVYEELYGTHHHLWSSQGGESRYTHTHTHTHTHDIHIKCTGDQSVHRVTSTSCEAARKEAKGCIAA